MVEVSVRKKLESFVLSVDFSIGEGEYLTVIGRSGAGKSTLAKVLSGVEGIDSGSIKLNGREISHLPPEKRRISYLPQGNSLFPHMTVLENLLFPLKVKGKKDFSGVNSIVEKFKIGRILDRRPREISGGEAQRASLARAILSEPEVIILDEPLNQLDFFTKTELIEELKKLKGNLTVIHITHDPLEAMELSDKVLLLEKGKVIFLGSWEELIERGKGELPERIRSFFPYR